MDAIKVSVIIVSYNTARLLERCLAALLPQLAHLSAEVIVLDNASVDASPEIIRAWTPRVRFLMSSQNIGFASAVNAAGRVAQGEYLLLLNPDAEVLPGAIEKILVEADRMSGRSVFGAQVLTSIGELEGSSCADLPSLRGAFGFATGLSTIFRGSSWANPEAIPDWNRNSVREVGVLVGNFLLLRAATFRLLNGFDERFFMYSEDVDLCARAAAAGQPPVYFPIRAAVHVGGASSTTSAEKLVLVLRGKVTYAQLHMGRRKSEVVRLLLAFGVLLRRCAAPLSGRSRPWSETWRRRSEWLSGWPAQQPGAAPAVVEWTRSA